MKAPFTRRPAAEQDGSDELVVYPARLRVALVMLGLFLADAFAFLGAFGFPPSFQLSVSHVIGLCILPLLTVGLVISLIGVFSPLPLFSISHDGVRTYSLFSLFGTELIPWPHLRRFVTYHARGEQHLKIYSDSQVPPGRSRLLRRLLTYPDELLRVDISSSIISGSIVVLLEQIDQRFGREIDENGVALVDSGENR